MIILIRNNMKRIQLFFLALLSVSCTLNAQNGGKPVSLTKSTFLEYVYNYEKNPSQFIYEGNKPCIVDFYADWCGPCKKIAPILNELADEYKDQIIIYKINTDQERELARAFGISSIPTLLFIPLQGDVRFARGALDKEDFEKAIRDILLKD